MRLPSTRTLEAFIVTARLGSLAAASERLGMSVPTLSRRLAVLEQELGVRLFDRLPRGVAATPAGTTYLGHAAAVVDRLRAASAELRRNADMVRITTVPDFAARWLLPRLAAFTERHPGIEIDVRTSDAFERLDDGSYDLAIRLAPTAGTACPPLLPVHVLPIWKPDGPFDINMPADVIRHSLIGPDLRPEFWREWLEAYGLPDVASERRAVDANLLFELAVAGAGVAIGIEPLVSGLLAQGRLAGLRHYRVRSSRSFFLIGREETPSRAAEQFSRWLRAEAQSSVDS